METEQKILTEEELKNVNGGEEMVILKDESATGIYGGVAPLNSKTKA